MGNRINKALIDRSNANTSTLKTATRKLTGANFNQVYADCEAIHNAWYDRFVRWYLTPSTSSIHIPNLDLYMQHLDYRNREFALGLFAANTYFGTMRTLRQDKHWSDNADMETHLSAWSSALCPPNALFRAHDFMTFDGLTQFFQTSYDFFDLLEYFMPNTYQINTKFLNAYEHKPNMRKLGCLATFEMQEKGLVLISIDYQKKTFSRHEESNPDQQLDALCALRALFGSVMFYRTVCTHAVQSHYITSAETALLLSTNKNHPLTDLFAPTLFMTRNGLARAMKPLFAENGFFHRIGPLTFTGLKEMIRTYINKAIFTDQCHYMSETGLEAKPPLYLNPDEVKRAPFAPFHTWSIFFNGHMEECIRIAYEEADEKVSLSPTTDLKLFANKLPYLYFAQVRHAYMTSTQLNPITLRWSYTMRTDLPVDLMCHDARYDHLNHILVDSSTAEGWIPLTVNLSDRIKNERLRARVNQFHTALLQLKIPAEYTLAQPNNITISTGL